MNVINLAILNTESEEVAPLSAYVNLFKKLKKTPEIIFPGHLMISRTQIVLLPDS